MINEEKILNAFPNATTRICKNGDYTYIKVEQDDKWIADFNIEWWHVEYKEPKTVIYSGDGYADGEMVYDMANCPNCDREFEDGDETWNCNFCPDCGQALKWESEDKK